MITPENTSTTWRFFLVMIDNKTAKETLAIPDIKAKNIWVDALSPNRMATIAPTQAPDETPRISGEISGFWNIP